MRAKFEVNPYCKVEKILLDDGENFVIVVDDFLLNPEEVVKFASTMAYFDPVGTDQTYYPGVRDLMPAPYGRALQKWIEPMVSEEYFFNKPLKSPEPVCKLSLVTLAAEDLVAAQKIPHVDSACEYDFAFVHYFCEKPFGGTSLYRYKPTGGISVKDNHLVSLREMSAAAAATGKEHSGYISGDTSLFERVAKVEAKFNRLVFYKSNLLHSADIPENQPHPKDVLSGRLTVASFMYFEPV